MKTWMNLHVVGMLLMAGAACGTTVYWDPDGAQPTSGGAGTWTGSVWYDGASYVAGAAGDDYVFSAGSGSVANNTSRTINSLRVSANGYTIGSSEIIVTSVATTAFTLDASLNLNLNSRIRNTSDAIKMTIGSGSTVTYAGASFLGNSNVGGSIYGGGTLIVNSGGFALSTTVNRNRIAGGSTLRAGMNGLFDGSTGLLRVESGSTNHMNNKTQGTLDGSALTGDILGALVTGAGSRWLGGGSLSTLAIRGSTTGVNVNFGSLSVTSGGVFDTEGGSVALFTSNLDPADVTLSGGSTLATGAGKLTLGQLGPSVGGPDTGQAITISGTGGSTLSGRIELSNGYATNPVSRSRTIAVADGAETVDFVVSAAIANGSVAGSGITKTGAGTLELSGTNTYTGATTVNNGTLRLSGALGTSRIVIGASGRLEGGNGTIRVTSNDVIAVTGTLDASGIFFDMRQFVAGSVTVADRSTGGTVANLSGASVSAGWALGTVGQTVVASFASPVPAGMLILFR